MRKKKKVYVNRKLFTFRSIKTAEHKSRLIESCSKIDIKVRKSDVRINEIIWYKQTKCLNWQKKEKAL